MEHLERSLCAGCWGYISYHIGSGKWGHVNSDTECPLPFPTPPAYLPEAVNAVPNDDQLRKD